MLKKIILIVVLALIGIFVFIGIPAGKSILSILSAYSAKAACSCVYIANRDLETVVEQELAAYASFVEVAVDKEEKTATASALGLERVAMYRKGLGCALVPTEEGKVFEFAGFNTMTRDIAPENQSWPMGDLDTLAMPEGVNAEALAASFDKIFTDNNPDLLQNTRAAVVVYKDKIIGERYAEGFTAETPQLGWSMTKSVTSALVGILVGEGKLDIHKPAPIPEWQGETDKRKDISLDHLLRMSSGLDFDEKYFGDEDATRMLFLEASAPDYAIKSGLAHEPGTFWSYSSGTSNIISKIVRDQFPTHEAYLRFPQEALFNKIGMRNSTMETDAEGNFVGSSFMYATARDWARFGLLYLHDGVWQGERILPEGWVDYSRTRTPSSEHGIYAAQFWTAATKFVGTPMSRYWPDLPDDIYYASGFEGQQVVIVPSKDLVIVRLGLTSDRKAWDLGAFIREVINSLEA